MQVGSKLRSTADGQLGTLVEDETGELLVRLDRPAERREVPYRAPDWTEAPTQRLTKMQLARIAYDADRALRLVSGEYGIAEWHGMKEQHRMPWLNGPPPTASEQRLQLYRAVLSVFQ